IEIAVLVEDPRVQQLIFRADPAALPVGLYQIGIGIGGLRVFVEILHVGVGRRAIEVEVDLLHILAVIAFVVGEAEEPLLQDRVAPVPERECEAETLLAVGNAGDPVLAPAIGARARLVMAEVIPGVAVSAVVLADRAPLPLAQIRSPPLPANRPIPGVAKTV